MVKLSFVLRWNGYHNIPKKYIKRSMFKGVIYENDHGLTPPVIYNYTSDWNFSEHAPWTAENQRENDPAQRKDKAPLVVPLKDWYWFRGDLVKVLVGKDAGKIGEIIGIIRQRNWVIVNGLNCKLDVFGSGSSSVMRQIERPLIVNKEVKLIDPYNKEPCEAVWRYTEDGKQVRISKLSGRLIPIPAMANATVDYGSKKAYIVGKYDTPLEEYKKKTFKPKLKTFEEDLADEYGMEKETKTRAETYIY